MVKTSVAQFATDLKMPAAVLRNQNPKLMDVFQNELLVFGNGIFDGGKSSRGEPLT